mmetsp:Transcript_13282/g.39503  ORF Transcript_13282/g.39503 Transcript_13282/m.39503 type:complete len:216 (+) Transcript_13282:674-1321(+)
MRPLEMLTVPLAASASSFSGLFMALSKAICAKDSAMASSSWFDGLRGRCPSVTACMNCRQDMAPPCTNGSVRRCKKAASSQGPGKSPSSSRRCALMAWCTTSARTRPLPAEALRTRRARRFSASAVGMVPLSTKNTCHSGAPTGWDTSSAPGNTRRQVSAGMISLSCCSRSRCAKVATPRSSAARRERARPSRRPWMPSAMCCAWSAQRCAKDAR